MATLYVNASTGNDLTTKAANSALTPWRTIGRAVWGSGDPNSPVPSQAASAGDFVSIAAGTYSSALVATGIASSSPRRYRVLYNPVNAGSSGSPITLQAQGTVVLTAPSYGGPIIGSTEKNYITWTGPFLLDEANITTTPDTGSVVLHNCTGSIIDGIEVDGNVVGLWDDNHTGIRLDSATSCIVRNCSIHDVHEIDPGHNGACIMTYDSTDCIIENNWLRDSGSGVFLKGAAVAQSGNIVRNNIIQGCVEGIIVHVAASSRVYQNVVHGCTHGILIFQFDASQGPTNSWVFNNTVYNCNLVGMYWRGAVSSLIGARAYNNIIANCGYGSFSDVSGLPAGCDSEHNVFYSNGVFFSSGGGNENFATYKSNYGEDAVSPASIDGQDPLFVDAGGGDFRLQAGSPARTIGSSIYGLGGADGTVIPAGAYITMTEVLGPGGSSGGGPGPGPGPTATVVPLIIQQHL